MFKALSFEAMDRLDLCIEDIGERQLLSETEVASIYINGERLADLAKAVELPLLEVEQPEEELDDLADAAGNYVGLLPSEVFFPSPHLLRGSIDEPLQQYSFDGRSILMVCSCGLAACNAFAARITVEPDKVIWQDFFNPTRPMWDYSALGPFTFDKKEYLAALRWPEEQPI